MWEIFEHFYNLKTLFIFKSGFYTPLKSLLTMFIKLYLICVH